MVLLMSCTFFHRGFVETSHNARFTLGHTRSGPGCCILHYVEPVGDMNQDVLKSRVPIVYDRSRFFYMPGNGTG